MPRSSGSVERAKMYTPSVLLLLALVGGSLAYYVQRETPYYTGPNDPYPIVNYNVPEQSQRLFWGGQGSNQVGGTGFWATLTNKFPFLGNMFGRMELPREYGTLNQFDTRNQYTPGLYQTQGFQPGFQRAPFGRDVAITDDAVIVTPPHVPISPQPAPAPLPQPAPVPQPSPGYHYEKPQNRLELP